MLKISKLMFALLVISSAILIPIYAQEPCEKCKANPENCKLMTGGECENPEGCQIVVKTEGGKSTIEKKFVVMQSDMDRGFLGIVTKETDKGLAITKVIPESPAEKAGLKQDDIILQAKGKSVKTQDELIDVLKGTKPKDMVSFKIKSGDKEKTMDIELTKAPAQEMKMMAEMPMMKKEIKCPECAAKIPMPMCPMMDKCPMMTGKGPMMMEEGMPMMKKMEKEFMVMPPKETRGFIGVVTEEEDGKLVIQSVVPNSPAEKTGLMEEDVIAEINSIPVTEPSELIEELKTTKPGDMAHLKIISGGVEKMVDVKLGTPPAPKPQQMKIKIGTGRKHGGGAGYFGPGFLFFDYAPINRVLNNHHLSSLNKRQFAFGGGGWGQVGRVRIGGYGIGGSQSVSNDTLDVEVSYGAGFFELGYTLAKDKNFMFTPLFGIGGGGISMKITPSTLLYHPVNLDDVLNMPGGIAKVSKGGFTLYPGLAIDIPFGFAGISLKGGYMWTPMSSSWTIEELNRKIAGPDFELKGPFASVNIMFGGR